MSFGSYQEFYYVVSSVSQRNNLVLSEWFIFLRFSWWVPKYLINNLFSLFFYGTR